MHDRFELVLDKRDLSGTDYFEFIPGTHQGTSWNEGSAFLKDEDFAELEFLFVRVAPNFDRFEYQEFDRETLKQFIDLLRAREPQVREARSISELMDALGDKWIKATFYDDEHYSQRAAIATMMTSLADWLEKTLREHNSVTILGL